jgi:hypothetical protein
MVENHHRIGVQDRHFLRRASYARSVTRSCTRWQVIRYLLCRPVASNSIRQSTANMATPAVSESASSKLLYIIQHLSDCDGIAMFRISSNNCRIWPKFYKSPMQFDLFRTNSKYVLTWVEVQSSHCLQKLHIGGNTQRVPGEPLGAKDVDQSLSQKSKPQRHAWLGNKAFSVNRRTNRAIYKATTSAIGHSWCRHKSLKHRKLHVQHCVHFIKHVVVGHVV